MILCSASFDYLIAQNIQKCQSSDRKRLLLVIVSISVNLSVLFTFKYYDFFLNSSAPLIKAAGIEFVPASLDLILPLGISFYTFLAISYIVDIYRRILPAEKHYSRYLLYVFFWPHMIAGPILRPAELLNKLNFIQIGTGIQLFKSFHYIIIGLFLKVVLGDQIGPWVDEAYSTQSMYMSGIDVFTMAYAFGLQIYFDFAGYSMIAIGSAQLLGIKFPFNFRWPYLAVNPRDFWRRWHITLSSWIRDYLYLPLQGIQTIPSSSGGIDHLARGTRQPTHTRMLVALFLTWFIMGLWHGSSWLFAFWGIWHACLIIIFRTIGLTNIKYSIFTLKGLFSNFLTIPLIMLGWIFFRAPSVEYALSLFGIIFSSELFSISLAFRENFYLLVFVFYFGMFFCFYLETYWYKKLFNDLKSKILFLTILDSALLAFIWLFWGGENQFIYFQF